MSQESSSSVPGTPGRRRSQMPLLRSQSRQEELRLGCMKGDMTILELHIKGYDSDTNQIFQDAWTPLMVVANGAYPTLTKFLLSHGANPNLARPDGFSPLMAALTSSCRGRVLVQQCVQLLVDAGADVNCRSNNGITPILLAVRDNRMSVVDLLISHGANVNVTDGNGRTISEIAKEKNYEKIVQTLTKCESGQLNGPSFAERSESHTSTAKQNSLPQKEGKADEPHSSVETKDDITLKAAYKDDAQSAQSKIPQVNSTTEKELREEANPPSSIKDQEVLSRPHVTPLDSPTSTTQRTLDEDPKKQVGSPSAELEEPVVPIVIENERITPSVISNDDITQPSHLPGPNVPEKKSKKPEQPKTKAVSSSPLEDQKMSGTKLPVLDVASPSSQLLGGEMKVKEVIEGKGDSKRSQKLEETKIFEIKSTTTNDKSPVAATEKAVQPKDLLSKPPSETNVPAHNEDSMPEKDSHTKPKKNEESSSGALIVGTVVVLGLLAVGAFSYTKFQVLRRQ